MREGAAGQTILGAESLDGKPATARGDADQAVSDDPFGAIGSAVGDGSGKAFVWVLLLIALVCGAAAWLRYRRGSGEDAPA